ncbi:MAG: hypothetical protein WD075_05615 [Rhodospirillales bacterium]
MDFPLNDLHANRHSIERRNLLPMLHAVEATMKLSPDGEYEEDRTLYYEQYVKPLEDEIVSVFPKNMTDREVWEIVLREQYWEAIITGWQQHGAALFSFSQALISKLAKTDVLDTPIQFLRIPYRQLYVSLPGGFLPDFDPDFEIDGFYLTSEQFLPDTLKNGFKLDATIVAEAESNYRRFGEEAMSRLYQIYDANSFDQYVGCQLEENAKSRTSYERYLNDPDEWYDIYGKKEWSPYWMLFVDFTFRSKSKRVGPWNNEYIASEPILRADYTFPNHRSTVKDAIAETRANGLPLETFFEGEDRPNDLRNVVSSPIYLDDVTRLVFNIVCYLNWPERDELKRLNSARAQARIDRLPSQRKRRKEQSKAVKEGMRIIHFCGHRVEDSLCVPHTSETTVATHWRRGHWRNQRCGSALSETKLMWIAPTLVKAADDTGQIVTTIYDIEKDKS